MYSVIEVGAHWGDDTVRLLNDDQHTVYSFEPFPELVFKLQERFKSYSNFYLVPMAVDIEAGWRWFNVANVHRAGISSLFDFNPEISSLWPKLEAKYEGRYRIMTTRLDTFMEANKIDSVDYLWVDAQGNDWNVLKSLGGRIDCIKEGKCETSYKTDLYNGPTNDYRSVVNWLEDRGFETAVVPEGGLNEADVHFRRK